MSFLDVFGLSFKARFDSEETNMTTIEFDKKLTCGSDFVAVKVLANDEEINIGGIYLPDSF